MAACIAAAAFLAFTSEDGRGSDEFRLLKLDGNYVKWGKPELGTGATVRYALVTAPMRFPDALNCRQMVPLDPLLKRSELEPSRAQREIAAAFAMWESAADIRFEVADDPRDADILIGAQGNPRGWAFANVSYDEAATEPVKPIEKALVCLNPEKPWKIGFGGNAFAYDLRYAIAHEIGHAIGLNHAGPAGQVMSYKYGEDFRTLQGGDRRGAVALYGKRDVPVADTLPGPIGAEIPELGLR